MLGDSLRDTSLSTTEGTWDSAGTALHSGEEGVKDSLSCQERNLAGKLLSSGASLTHGPEVAHVNFLLLSVELNHNDWLVHSVLATWHDLLNLTVDLGRNHDSVLGEEVVLEDKTENITSAHVVSGLEFIAGGPVPSLVLIKAGYVHTTGHKNAFRQVSNGLKGALNTIENRVQDT